MEAGAEGLEFDLQKTADGRFVIIHDENLERTTNGKGMVGETTLEELKKLETGQGEAVPELNETLAHLADFRSVTLNVELKEETLEPGDFAAIDALLSPRKYTFRFHISSFRHDLLVPFARAGYETGMLIGTQHEREGIRGICAAVRHIRPACLNLPVTIYERIPGWIRRPVFTWWRLRGLKLAFWTVNSEEEYRKVARDAAVVMGDYPAKLLEWRGS